MRVGAGTLAVAIVIAVAVMVPNARSLPSPAPKIAYTTGNPGDNVWVASVTGRDARRLGSGLLPRLSPNGALVAASTDLDAAVLYPTDGGARRVFKNVDALDGPVAWSSDSRYVAFEAAPIGGLGGLTVIDTQTGTATIVARGAVAGASFAPNSSDELAYAMAPSLTQLTPINIFTIAPNGTGNKAITTDGRSLEPVWGARGIAFDRERLRRHEVPADQIWMMDPDGSHLREITHTKPGPRAVGLVPFSFSAAGTRLLADWVSGRDSGSAWTILLGVDHVHELKSAGKRLIGAQISRSGKEVLVEQGSANGPSSASAVEEIPFFGGRATELIPHADDATWNR